MPAAKRASVRTKALDMLIEKERRRLNRAEAILTCLSAALSQCDSDASALSDAADAARDVIAEAVDRLDSVNRRRLVR